MIWRSKDKDRAEPEGDGPAGGVQWSMGSRLVTTAATVGLWVAIACGPIGLGWAIGRPNLAAAAAPAVARDDLQEPSRALAEEFAARIVTVWLSAHRGQEALVSALLPGARGQSLPKVGLQVSNPVAVRSTVVADGVWSVTVAAQVSDARSSARRFFVVPIQVVGESVVAVALPSERPGPQVIAAGPDLDYGFEVTSGSALETVAADFLNALLAGSGDVERLTSPSAQIRAVLPAPFTAVKVSRVAAQREVPQTPSEGAQLDVLVTAVAQGAAEQQVSVQYPLVLTVRAGRWEVSAVRDSPLLAKKKTGSSATPSAKPAPAGSVTPSGSASAPPASEKSKK